MEALAILDRYISSEAPQPEAGSGCEPAYKDHPALSDPQLPKSDADRERGEIDATAGEA